MPGGVRISLQASMPRLWGKLGLPTCPCPCSRLWLGGALLGGLREAELWPCFWLRATST